MSRLPRLNAKFDTGKAVTLQEIRRNVPKQLQESCCFSVNGTRQVAGYKAAIHNPNVSDEAKERAAAKIEEIQHEMEHDLQEPLDKHVVGGYKAVLKNPNVSQQAKKHAKEVLESQGIEIPQK